MFLLRLAHLRIKLHLLCSVSWSSRLGLLAVCPVRLFFVVFPRPHRSVLDDGENVNIDSYIFIRSFSEFLVPERLIDAM
jgi:hypothetical protein